jgi:hypothetical protein
LSRLLHDLVPSQHRSGVSSGIGTLSWLTFLPCSLLFGALSNGGAGPDLDQARKPASAPESKSGRKSRRCCR